MADIRGEKVSFTKKDIVKLHLMPSAQAEDPIILRGCAIARPRLRRLIAATFGLLLLLVAAAGAAFYVIESGSADATLSSRAEAALNDAIGPRYSASVGSAAMRFTDGWHLAVEARDVAIVERATGLRFSRAGTLRLAIDPLALGRGQLAIRDIEASDIRMNAAQLPSGEPLPLSQVRVDAAPPLLEQAFQRLDEARGLIGRTQTHAIRIADIEVVLPAAAGRTPARLRVEDLELTPNADGELDLAGTISINGHRASLNAASTTVDGVTTALTARLEGLDVTTLLMQMTEEGAPREGLSGRLDFDLAAVRAREATRPSISAKLRQSPGFFYVDGIRQAFSGAEINVAYDFSKNSLEVLPSRANFGRTELPFTGAIIDLNRLDAADLRAGFGIDLLIRGGTAAGATEHEELAHFDLHAGGRYLLDERELQFDEMQLSSSFGQMAGSARVRFGEKSPEVSFGGSLPKMDVAGVKQFWPFWMAAKPRDWVMENLFGGTITDGSIAVFIPEGRMRGPGIPMELDENELQVRFDIAGARVDLPGDIPPLREVQGRFDLKGEKMTVAIEHGRSFFASGREVTLEKGSVAIASTYDKPLMADFSLKLAGKAAALAELADFRPIEGLKDSEFVAGDFSGEARAQVDARIGLISAHNPPKTVWKAAVDLENVGLAREISGRRISGLNGRLDIDRQAARLAAKGGIDGVEADIALVEPIDDDSTARRQQVIKAVLNNAQRRKIAPGLDDLIDGPVSLEMTRLEEDRQSVVLNLTRARLSVPWLGWSKGTGIAARATFELGGSEERMMLRKFDLSGDGFGARGQIALAGGDLVSADFSELRLSPADRYAVGIRRDGRNYDITVGGASADLRPVMARLKQDHAESGGDAAKGRINLRLSLDRIIGFNDQSLVNPRISASIRDGRLAALDLSGVFTGQQAVVGSMDAAGNITLTSGDAGAFLRFLDLYENMRSGLLNVKLREQNKAWAGSIDLRNFALVNEPKLKSLVSTSGRDGRSLNSAVRREIEVGSVRFQRAHVGLLYRGGAFSVENGVIRGDQIGATFQGLVRDAKGRMEMTGTFMPAYGLNRLFAELPLIGVILGNGRDRGLLGITFKLDGRFDKPRLTVNPLSLIAPGIFRQIFEFQ